MKTAKKKWYYSNLYAVPSSPRSSGNGYYNNDLRQFQMKRGRISASCRRPGTWAIKRMHVEWQLFMICPDRRCRGLMTIHDPVLNKRGRPPHVNNRDVACDTCPKCHTHMWYSLMGFTPVDYKKLYRD